MESSLDGIGWAKPTGPAPRVDADITLIILQNGAPCRNLPAWARSLCPPGKWALKSMDRNSNAWQCAPIPPVAPLALLRQGPVTNRIKPEEPPTCRGPNNSI